MSALRSHELLRLHLAKKQRSNSGYSQRALARDIGVSSGFISAVFSGKKQLSAQKLDHVARRLEIDSLELNVLKKALLMETLESKHLEQLDSLLESELKPVAAYLESFEAADRHSLQLWSRWYYVAIMDLSTCTGFQIDPAWIAEHLSIPEKNAAAAIHFLKTSGFLTKDETGNYTKSVKHLRLPTKASTPVIRAYHEQMMLRSIQTMQKNVTAEAFAQRLISGLVVATNPAQVEKAKRRLETALHEVAEILLNGEPMQLYHVAGQLVPLSKPIKTNR